MCHRYYDTTEKKNGKNVSLAGYQEKTDLSKCFGYRKLEVGKGMCTHNNIKRMIEAYGDASIKVYERSGQEIAVTMKLVDCLQYTKGEAGGINDAEFSFENFDACETLDFTFDKLFNMAFGEILNPSKGMFGKVGTNGGKWASKLGVFGSVIPKLTAAICKLKEDSFLSNENNYAELVVCNQDSLMCPRASAFAQNGGCNIR